MWLVQGAWAWLIVSTLVKWYYSGDLSALNHLIPGLVLVLLIHGGFWLYRKNKKSEEQPKKQPAHQEAHMEAEQAKAFVEMTRQRNQQIQTELQPITERFFIVLSILILISGLSLAIMIFAEKNYYSDLIPAAVMISLGAFGLKRLKW